MPYSDNLYSALDEEPELEPIGQSSARYGDRGAGVTPRRSRLDAANVHPVTHADEETAGLTSSVSDEDPHALSPTDGYFGTATSPSSTTALPASCNVPHVPNVLVDDPSLQRSEAESKAREAEQETLPNGQGRVDADDGGPLGYLPMSPSRQSVGSSSQSLGATYTSPSSSTPRPPPSAAPSSSYTPYSSRRSAYQGEHFPFLPTEAPPAYTPSPTSPLSRGGFSSASRSYSTFSRDTSVVLNMGRPEEAQGLLAHQPESMRDRPQHGVGDDESPTWAGRVRRMGRHLNRGGCKIALVFLLLLMVTAGFLTTLLTDVPGRTGHRNPDPDQPGTPPGQPSMRYPDIDGGFSWDAAFACKDAQIPRHKQTLSVSFGADKQLTIVEKVADDQGRRGWREVHVQGAVVFRRVGSDTPNSSAIVEVTVTDERLVVATRFDADEGKLQVTVPHSVEWSPEDPRACVHIKITVWVPEDSSLKRLLVDTVHLDVKLLDNLSLSVHEGTKLISTVGTVTSASTGSSARDDSLIDSAGGSTTDSYAFHSRIIDVRTTAAPINGAWPLFDYLGLQSTSGNIKVSVCPREADPDTLAPATLYIKSLSGDVSFREPVHAAEQTFRIGQAFADAADRRRAEIRAAALLPPRDYRVDVHTTSGDIVAAAAFSRSAGFKSTSGTIDLELLPVLDASLAAAGSAGGFVQTKEVALQTTSTSGATDVTVLEPLWIGEAVLSAGEGESTGTRRKPGYVSIIKTKASSASASTSSTAIFHDGKDDGGDKDSGDEPPPLRSLYSTHATTSANIRLRYPGSWEGDVSLSTLTGTLQVGGEDVRLIKAGSDWPGVNKSMLARKGEKGVGGAIGAKSTSGSIEVWVGREEKNK